MWPDEPRCAGRSGVAVDKGSPAQQRRLPYCRVRLSTPAAEHSTFPGHPVGLILETSRVLAVTDLSRKVAFRLSRFPGRRMSAGPPPPESR